MRDTTKKNFTAGFGDRDGEKEGVCVLDASGPGARTSVAESRAAVLKEEGLSSSLTQNQLRQGVISHLADDGETLCGDTEVRLDDMARELQEARKLVQFLVRRERKVDTQLEVAVGRLERLEEERRGGGRRRRGQP